MRDEGVRSGGRLPYRNRNRVGQGGKLADLGWRACLLSAQRLASCETVAAVGDHGLSSVSLSD